MNDQLEELEVALRSMADGEYQATAVKIELEAQLNRPDDEDECCDSCDGDGYNVCEPCDGSGTVEVENDAGREVTVDCDECDEGRVECSDCNGSGRYGSGEWDEDDCSRFILSHVSDKAKAGLTYSRFYNDGSVDSEFTFTLWIAYAVHAVEFIRAFKLLSQEIGNGLGTSGAGMHIAILNDPDGRYGYGPHNELDEYKTGNFVRSVTPLLPALYFLGSADYRSRGLGYRKPWISSPWHNDAEKYSAINGAESCFEYRLFETCYDRPETVYDYLIVIANTLKYYSSHYTDTSMKIGKLGFKEGEGVQRFYYSSKHIEALTRGLRLLKPQYKAISTLKKERNFTYSLSNPKSIELALENKWKEAYPSIKRRQSFEKQSKYHTYVAEYYSVIQRYGMEEAVVRTKCTRAQAYAYMRLRRDCDYLYGGLKGYLKLQKQVLENDVDYYVEC